MAKRVWNVNPKYVQSRSLFFKSSAREPLSETLLIIIFFDIYLEKG